MAFITVSLKLYKPSKVKREMMDHALENYSRAFGYILEKIFYAAK